MEEMKDVVSIITKKESGVDGLIISNTTIDRSSLLNKEFSNEAGGLSGKPLSNKSTEMIKNMYKLTKGQFCLKKSFWLLPSAISTVFFFVLRKYTYYWCWWNLQWPRCI